MLKWAFALTLAVGASVAQAGDIVMDMRGDGVDTNALVPGQQFDVLIGLAAPAGTTIDHVRMMQFQETYTAGSSIDNFDWEITGINDSLYFKEKYSDIPDVVRANYLQTTPIPGFILNLTDTPTVIGRYTMTFNEPGKLDLVGLPNDDGHRDEGLYYQTGFASFGGVETYFVGKGNILPGGDSTSAGILPLVPEPTTLGLLGIGALALLRRRNRR